MNNYTYLFVIYAVSFLSGSAALVYEICWFRSLSLVLGGSQIAVTITVSVFMLGLAVGSRLAAEHMRRFGNLLFLYGIIELGISMFAAIFLLLLKVYPDIYTYVTGFAGGSPPLMTAVRIFFSAFAILVPAVLMGATLPVLAGLLAGNAGSDSLSPAYLYGVNTLGAVAGALAAGFYLLRTYHLSTVVCLAAGVNFSIGMASLLLKGGNALFAGNIASPEAPDEVSSEDGFGRFDQDVSSMKDSRFLSGPILWGLGVSGFCALGYEVLWTRILILFLDATVYSFTIILVAFLLGISMGSASYGIFRKFAASGKSSYPDRSQAAIGFGVSQLLIGATTLLVMMFLLDIPAYSIFLENFFFRITGRLFFSRQFSNFVLSFVFVAIPAFFMGLSVPLAVRVYTGWGKKTGRALGELLAYNTFGGIFGAYAGGHVFLYLVGIERSIQVLCLINAGVGTALILGVYRKRRAALVAGMVSLLLISALLTDIVGFRIWGMKYLATYTPNSAAMYRNEFLTKRQLDNHEVLYYAEGRDSIVSSTLRRDTNTMQFSVNGRPEASTNLEDVQNQYMLGHLPMLLHKNPKKALVIGAGSGMTLAAVAAHPGLKRLHLVEMEPKVIGVAQAFGAYNHNVIGHQNLKIFFEDARNHLLASRQKYDVITSDPIHPVYRGSGYLYTSEYFRLAAEHLSPGGIMCQWLPLYLLSRENVKSIVRTFSLNFRYAAIWLTLDDVQLVGSNEPIIIDEKALEKRIESPAVSEDLREVYMESVDDLLGYFLMGNRGASAFSAGAVVNTDDNVYLEFSSPEAIGLDNVESVNIAELLKYREGVESYLIPQGAGSMRKERQIMVDRINAANGVSDMAHMIYLSKDKDPDSLRKIFEEMNHFPNTGRMLSLKAGLSVFVRPLNP